MVWIHGWTTHRTHSKNHNTVSIMNKETFRNIANPFEFLWMNYRLPQKSQKWFFYSIVATTIEITTTIEIIISIVVENEFQTKHHIATTNEITTTIEIVISIEVENAFKTKQSVAHYWKNDHYWNDFYYWNSNVLSE